jgi:SAM-dependent methyltransferase
LDASGGGGRGTPIDRYYVARFVECQARRGDGRMLEFRETRYARSLGYKPENVDVLDVVAENQAATIVADLGEAHSLPANAFDCILLADSFRWVPDLEVALVNAWQSLTPGGVLLLCVPALAPVKNDTLGSDRWRILPIALEELLQRVCPAAAIEVVTYGNLLAATALLVGLAVEEVSPQELDLRDDRFPVVVAASVRR